MKPKVGDSVWAEGFKQPNGQIMNIDWYDKEVHVLFFDTNEQEAFEWSRFDCFNDQLNQWIINN